MNKKLKNLILGTAMATTIVGGAYLAKNRTSNPFIVQGELVRDYVQNVPNFGEVYRIAIENEEGVFTYPILATSDEARILDDQFVSREETGARGDIVRVNTNTNVFSLDEIVLLSSNIRKIKSHKKLPDPNIITLSSGMTIPRDIVSSIDEFAKGKVYRIRGFYGPEYDHLIFDEGDGRPYESVKELDYNDFREDGSGKRKYKTIRIEKNFNFTYKFCDKPEHGPYPIWEPEAFRSDPCYGVGIIKPVPEANK